MFRRSWSILLARTKTMELSVFRKGYNLVIQSIKDTCFYLTESRLSKLTYRICENGEGRFFIERRRWAIVIPYWENYNGFQCRDYHNTFEDAEVCLKGYVARHKECEDDVRKKRDITCRGEYREI